MDDWEADETATVEGDCTSWCRALFWIVPPRSTARGRRKRDAHHQQQFSASQGPWMGARHRRSLRGDTIEFTAGGVHYTARERDHDEGHGHRGSNGTWSATPHNQSTAKALVFSARGHGLPRRSRAGTGPLSSGKGRRTRVICGGWSRIRNPLDTRLRAECHFKGRGASMRLEKMHPWT